MTRSDLAFVSAAVVAVITAGCGSSPSPRRHIDELRGALGDVHIGEASGAVIRSQGQPTKPIEAYPIEPLSAEDGAGGPWSVDSGPFDRGSNGPRVEQVTYRYRDASYFVKERRVIGFMVTGHAVTSRGVEIGDALARIREAYPELRCQDATRGETTALQEAHCAGRIGGYHVWFGGDPVASVTVMQRAFSTYPES